MCYEHSAWMRDACSLCAAWVCECCVNTVRVVRECCIIPAAGGGAGTGTV